MSEGAEDLEDRKAAILRAIVTEYIATAQPVGSTKVSNVAEVSVSSATVRNEMLQLEQLGYLHQPYTSAGRIPTDAGYRYFVDNLTAPGELQAEESRKVRHFFDAAHSEIEGVLRQTSDLLANLTGAAAVVVGPELEPAAVRNMQLVELSPNLILCVVVLANGSIEKINIELTNPVGAEALAEATTVLQSAYGGVTLSSSRSVRLTNDADTDILTGLVAAALQPSAKLAEDTVFVGGRAQVASAFDAIDTVREVLGILEKQLTVVTLLRDVLDRGMTVSIGAENGVAPLAECSLVVAPYEVDGRSAGTIGVLGPTRMNYSQALAAVAVVSDRLGAHLTEG